MMLLDAPSLTKKVPAIEAATHTPQIRSGRAIILVWNSGAKKIDARSMVATTVTA